MARGYRFGVVGSISTVPDGKTVLPTDDIQIWLKCASIKDKAYTTLSQVLADSTTLQALISSNNAVDYMVRSTTWASGVTADSGAMTLIGGNNYCANTLLGNLIWRTEICNSTYFESVLNVKVPAMTSNTTPSGECFGSSVYSSGSTPYYNAFDDASHTTTRWQSKRTEYYSSIEPEYIGYDFGYDVTIYAFEWKRRNPSATQDLDFLYHTQIFNNDVWNNVFEWSGNSNKYVNLIKEIVSNPLIGTKIRLYFDRPMIYGGSGTGYVWDEVLTVQFYGRVDV
jgi:hypothetical protein